MVRICARVAVGTVCVLRLIVARSVGEVYGVRGEAVSPMTSAETHVLILQRVAAATSRDARSAREQALASPTEAHLRAAFRACKLAARALRRASMGHPNELALIEESMLMEEWAFGLCAQLVPVSRNDR